MADDVVRLRQAFERLADRPRTDAACLDAEWMWTALAGERPAAEVRSAVLHLAECGECAEAWRLARELALASGVELTGPALVRDAVRPAWRSPWVWLPAAAATVVLGVGLAVDREPWRTPADSGTTWRAGVERGVALGVADGAELPREAFVLRWEPPAGASHYAVRVTTDALGIVSTASNLLEPEYHVPASALERLEPGTKLLWQVEAFGPDRVRLQSPVRVVILR
jgi:hypothetical protein